MTSVALCSSREAFRSLSGRPGTCHDPGNAMSAFVSATSWVLKEPRGKGVNVLVS